MTKKPSTSECWKQRLSFSVVLHQLQDAPSPPQHEATNSNIHYGNHTRGAHTMSHLIGCAVLIVEGVNESGQRLTFFWYYRLPPGGVKCHRYTVSDQLPNVSKHLSKRSNPSRLEMPNAALIGREGGSAADRRQLRRRVRRSGGAAEKLV